MMGGTRSEGAIGRENEFTLLFERTPCRLNPLSLSIRVNKKLQALNTVFVQKQHFIQPSPAKCKYHTLLSASNPLHIQLLDCSMLGVLWGGFSHSHFVITVLEAFLTETHTSESVCLLFGLHSLSCNAKCKMSL